MNVYFPNGDSSLDRAGYKLDFAHAVEARVRQFVAEGLHVILLGDLNICAREIDCYNPEQEVYERGGVDFVTTPPRLWLQSFLKPSGGPMIDTFRDRYPNRRGAYTVSMLHV